VRQPEGLQLAHVQIALVQNVLVDELGDDGLEESAGRVY
jgi:hypothetical protein